MKSLFVHTALISLAWVSIVFPIAAYADDDGLVAHWKLTADARDGSGNGHHAINHRVGFDADHCATFDGIDAWLEVPADRAPKLGTKPFTIAAWIHTAEELDDVLGDIMSCFDPDTRNGFNFGLMNYAGVTSAQSNWRNVFFGIDAAKGGENWRDCGKPGNNQQIESLVVFDGDLYASTWEPGERDRGHVYRYAGGDKWIDCGAPDPANAIKGMAV